MKLKNLLKRVDNIGNLGTLAEGGDSVSPLYVSIFKELPSIQTIICTLNANKLISYFSKEYKILREELYRSVKIRDVVFIDYKRKIIISISYRNEHETAAYVAYNYNNPPKEDLKFLDSIRKENESPHFIYFIVGGPRGLELEELVFVDKFIDIEKNYNTDFSPINDKIMEDLRKQKSGIHILHGIPGTGKSSYIKYLISNIDKKFIYCPSSLVSYLSSPDFIKLILREGADSILIIEDAEEALVNKGTDRDAAVTNILNLSDGIIGDALNIQIIATFNTDFSHIDPAIVRKGRLLSKYEFKKLELTKTKELLHSLNLPNESVKEMNLSDIYNFKSISYETSKNKIGL